MPLSTSDIARFSFTERAIHWMTAISFLYAALTGLSMWSHHLYWLALVFGGGETTRWAHPWGGTLFALVLAVMFRNWARDMRLDADDKVWLANAKKYAVLEEEGSARGRPFQCGPENALLVAGSDHPVALRHGRRSLAPRKHAARRYD